MSGNGAPVYRAAAADSMRRIGLGALQAVYHRPSGLTHLLADPAPALLDLIARHPCNADAALAALHAEYRIDADDDRPEALRAVIAAWLAELAQFGLAEIEASGV